MSVISNFEDHTPHTVQEVICLKCLERWIAVFPTGVLLKHLECPECGKVGFVIATGQEISEGEQQ